MGYEKGLKEPGKGVFFPGEAIAVRYLEKGIWKRIEERGYLEKDRQGLKRFSFFGSVLSIYFPWGSDF